MVYMIENKKSILTRGQRKYGDDDDEDDGPARFTTKILFDDFPRDFEASNKRECSVKSLQKCDINDNSTLYGCRELNVRCHHFDDEFKYVDTSSDVEYVIPANEKPNEGYALAIASVYDSCNAYHGDPVLVSKSVTSKEYLMICRCRKEGYVGNDDLLGNCTTARICGDRGVVDINVPFEQLRCKCDESEISSRLDEKTAPFCRELTITEANERFGDKGWTSLLKFPSDTVFMSISMFSPTIRDNMKVQYLRSTCDYSLLDARQYLNSTRFDYASNSCVYEQHIPVKVDLLQETALQKTRSENTDYTYEIDTIAMYDAVIPSSEYRKIWVSDHVLAKRQIVAVQARVPWLMGGDATRNNYKRIKIGYNVGVAFNSMLFPRQSLTPKTVIGTCDHPYYNIFTYDCYLKPFSSVDTTTGRLPKAKSEYCCPWGYGNWDEAYAYIGLFADAGFGVEWRPKDAQKYNEKVKFYGMQYSARKSSVAVLEKDTDANGPLQFRDESAWKAYRALNDEI